MRFLCNNCILNCHIEEYKERLDDIIVKKQYNLLDEEVICLSQFLDDFISNCVFCNTNHLYNSNQKNQSEAYAIMYYYGTQHLSLNLYSYISNGLKNNEIIYFSMEETLYNQLKNLLLLNKVPIKNIKFKSLENINLEEPKNEAIIFKENFNKLLQNNKKYTKTKWVIQPSYAINSTSQKAFIDMNIILNEYVNNMKLNILYICDAYECMHKDKILEKKLIPNLIDKPPQLSEKLI